MFALSDGAGVADALVFGTAADIGARTGAIRADDEARRCAVTEFANDSAGEMLEAIFDDGTDGAATAACFVLDLPRPSTPAVLRLDTPAPADFFGWDDPFGAADADAAELPFPDPVLGFAVGDAECVVEDELDDAAASGPASDESAAATADPDIRAIPQPIPMARPPRRPAELIDCTISP